MADYAGNRLTPYENDYLPNCMTINPDVAEQTKKKKRKTSDWSTYRRLLGYLKGTGWVMVALLACMIMEAGFTAASIGMVKPLVELAAGRDDKWFEKSDKVAETKPSAAPKFAKDFVDSIKEKIEPRIKALQAKGKLTQSSNFKFLR